MFASASKNAQTTLLGFTLFWRAFGCEAALFEQIVHARHRLPGLQTALEHGHSSSGQEGHGSDDLQDGDDRMLNLLDVAGGLPAGQAGQTEPLLERAGQ
jgi:hypothetical protein